MGASSTAPAAAAERSSAGWNILSLRTLGLVTVIIIGVALIKHRSIDNCSSLINYGQWVGEQWYPFQCVLNRHHVDQNLRECLSSSSSRYVLFMGEKSLLAYYKAIVKGVSGDDLKDLPVDLEKNMPLNYIGLYTLDYVWSSKLDQKVLEYYETMLKSPVKSLPNVIVHQHLDYEIRQPDSPPEVVKTSCTDLVSHLIDLQTTYLKKFDPVDRPFIIILLYDPSLLGTVGKHCQQILQDVYAQASSTHPEIDQSLVLFHTSPLAGQQHQGFEIMAHFICHSEVYGNCCFGNDKSFYQSVMFPFLVLLLAVYAGLVFVRATGTLIPLEPYFEGASIDLDHCYSVIHVAGTIVLALLYSCTTDRLEFFASASPWQSSLLCSLLLVALVCLGFMKRVTVNQPTETMISREQICEWRGLAVLTLVALEYSYVAETESGSWLWVAMVSCVSCATGYVQFVSFWETGDFSMKRLVKILFRHNYLTIWFCLALHSSYTLYSVPLVMTQAVLIAYVTMATPPKLTAIGNSKVKVVMTKLCLVFALLVAFSAFELNFMPLAPTKLLFGAESSLRNGKLWTVPYVARITTMLGMAIACYLKHNKPHKTSKNISFGVVKGVFVVASFIVYGLFVSFGRGDSHHQIAHSILISVLILAYVTARNWTDKMMATYSYIYNYFGCMSIEFYVLFQHVMLSYNTRGLVYLFPSYYSVNMMATLTVVLFLSMSLCEWSRVVNETRPTPKSDDEELITNSNV